MSKQKGKTKPTQIAKSELQRRGKLPEPPPLPAQTGVTFSFKYLDQKTNEKFTFKQGQDGYPENLLERLKDLCGHTWQQIANDRTSSLRSHPIDFSHTSEPKGFSHLNDQLRQVQAHQFTVSANKHGRVHGIVAQNTFFVVWLDPAHKLYDGK